MSIVLFIIVLGVLIFVHELGHFLAAKSADVRVDEFGIGFPPRAIGYRPKNSETIYSLNWVPLGGFVKIFGEEAIDVSLAEEERKRNFAFKPKCAQIWILSAGVLGNLIAAWLLISIGFMVGLPASVESFDPADVTDRHIAVTGVLPGSPAEEAGMVAGDRLHAIFRDNEQKVIEHTDDVSAFIGTNTDTVGLTFERDGSDMRFEITPSLGVIGEEQAGLGIAIDEVGIVTLPIHRALLAGGKATVSMTGAVAVGLWQFFGDVFTGHANFSQIAGPVGIIGLVGDASALGFIYLLSFTALISINLAVINLVPFPALDGGRILFVIIEALTGSPIRPRVMKIANGIGFALLILLMVVVTYNDIAKLITG